MNKSKWRNRFSNIVCVAAIFCRGTTFEFLSSSSIFLVFILFRTTLLHWCNQQSMPFNVRLDYFCFSLFSLITNVISFVRVDIKLLILYCSMFDRDIECDPVQCNLVTKMFKSPSLYRMVLNGVHIMVIMIVENSNGIKKSKAGLSKIENFSFLVEFHIVLHHNVKPYIVAFDLSAHETS